MYSRLSDVPPLGTRETEIDAVHFNHVQVALKRLGGEIRLSIPKLKHLDLILQKDSWIIVDRVLNDIPVVAWTDFKTQHRSSLHEPIPCTLRTYHAAAGMVRSRTLEAMEMMLGELLNEETAEADTNILPFIAAKSDKGKT